MFARTVPPFLLFLCAVSIAADGHGQSRNIGTSLDPVIRPYLAPVRSASFSCGGREGRRNRSLWGRRYSARGH